MHKFENILAWQKSRALVKTIYQLSQDFPATEQYGLTNQLRRSVISIPSNIAEGSGRSSNLDFARFLDIALSSSFEVETQLLLGFDLSYLNKEKLQMAQSQVKEVQKLIFGFKNQLLKNKSLSEAEVNYENQDFLGS